MKHIILILLMMMTLSLSGQTFYYGQDLSYANQMEDCGAVFKENQVAKDIYQIFADHGTNLVRVRLWHNPSWQNTLVQPAGVKSQYSDFPDVKETILRAKNAGMQVMLDFHLSDFWCDPTRQVVPAAWKNVASNTSVLADSTYNYVSRILTSLNQDGLMPEIVKIGNENNGGILRYTGMNSDFSPTGSVSTDWNRHAVLFNAAIKAVRDVSSGSAIKSKIALHFAGLKNLVWHYTNNIVGKGITDFDIIGFSYYFSWHGYSISELGTHIRTLKSNLPQYEVMVVETGYLWSTLNYDSYSNIITTPDPNYLPVIPAKQREYMTDYAREVKRAGGSGVIFWEPDWVSTPCRTPWGQGSSQDHVAFFDPVTTNFINQGGGRWTEAGFYTNLNDKKVTFKVDMAGQDVSGGVYISGSWAGGQLFEMAAEGNDIYSFYAYLPQNSSGGYFFVKGNDVDNRETVPTGCALYNSTDRSYSVGTTDIKYAFKYGSCETANEKAPYVTFRVDMTGQDVSKGVYVVGEMNNWAFNTMTHVGNNIYSWTTNIPASPTMLAYYYIRNNSWTNYMTYRESVPSACALKWGTDRGIIVSKKDTVVNNVWASCEQFLPTSIGEQQKKLQANMVLSPNPCQGEFEVELPEPIQNITLGLYDFQGRKISCHIIRLSGTRFKIQTSSKGLLVLKAYYNNQVSAQKINIQ